MGRLSPSSVAPRNRTRTEVLIPLCSATIYPSAVGVGMQLRFQRISYSGNLSGPNRYRDSYRNRKTRFSSQKSGMTP